MFIKTYVIKAYQKQLFTVNNCSYVNVIVDYIFSYFNAIYDYVKLTFIII